MYHVLDIDFRHPKVSYWKDKKINVYKGSPLLPPDLQPYRSKDFSYQRWQEDELNGMVLTPETGKTKFSLREHQVEASKKILGAYSKKERGFLEADKTGLGKALSASTMIPTPSGFKTMQNIHVGDTVIDPNGISTTVTNKFTSKAKKFFRIEFSNGFTIDADSEHRWYVTPKKTNFKKPTPTEEKKIRILKTLKFSKYLAVNDIKEIIGVRTFKKFFNFLPTYNLPDKTQVMYNDDVMERIDALLITNKSSWVQPINELVTTEYLYNEKKYENYYIKKSKPVQGYYKDNIDFYSLGYYYYQKINNNNDNIKQYMEKFNIINNDSLDSIFQLNLDSSLLKDFAMGILDYLAVKNNNTFTIKESNKSIIENVFILLSRLGYVVNLDKENEDFILSVNFNDDKFFITNIYEINKVENFYCITVDSETHSFLAGESFIPTHNTLSSLGGIALIAKNNGYGKSKKAKLLIVCKKSAIPHWRDTIHHFPIISALCRIMIINYEQLNKLLEAPATARVAKKRSTKNSRTAKSGKPLINWDYIIADESHNLKNYPNSNMSVAFSNIAQLNEPYIPGLNPFVIHCTATPGDSILHLSCMSGLIAPYIPNARNTNNITPSEWGNFLLNNDFDVKKDKSGNYSWATVPWYNAKSSDPKKRYEYERMVKQSKLNMKRDSTRIGKALTHPNAPFIMRSPKDIAGWPEQQFIPLPLGLSYQQKNLYEKLWSDFRKWLNLNPRGRENAKTNYLVESIRYRQKTSLLKVDSMIDIIKEWIDTGNQVYISCEFMDTVERYEKLLETKKIPCVSITGRNPETREENRLKFQKGEAKVVISTVVESVSYHAGESLPDGSKATMNPRISLIHSLRENVNDTIQAFGRAHRDGKNSLTYLPYFDETIDEKIISRFITKEGNLNSMLGETTNRVNLMEETFRKYAAIASYKK